MSTWKLNQPNACQSDAWFIVKQTKDEVTNEPIYVVYRRRVVQSISDALTLASLVFGAGILAGCGLAMGWAWARGGF